MQQSMQYNPSGSLKSAVVEYLKPYELNRGIVKDPNLHIGGGGEYLLRLDQEGVLVA